MAVSTKTLTPTGQVVSIPDMTEKPNASVLSDGIGKEADAINALDSNMLPNKATKLEASSLSALKTVLVGLCNDTTAGSYKPIRYTSAFTSDGFVSGDTYQGFIFVNSKNDSALYFSVALFECTTNMPIYMRYTNGTWNIDGLALNSNITWKSAGSFGASAESLTLPISNWKELYVECRLFGSLDVCFSTYIAKKPNESRHYTALGYLSQKEVTDHGWSFTPQPIWVNFSVVNDVITFLSCDTLAESRANYTIGVYYR